jgi:hypothetical protein
MTEPSRTLQSRLRMKDRSRKARLSFCFVNAAQSISPILLVSGRELNSTAPALIEKALIEAPLIEVRPGKLSRENSVAASCLDLERELRCWPLPETKLGTQPLVAAATAPEKRGTILRPESYQGFQKTRSNLFILRLRDQARAAAFERSSHVPPQICSTQINQLMIRAQKDFTRNVFGF